MFGGTLSTPFIITPALCMEDGDPGKGTVISTVFFVSGIVTLLQSTFGVRYITSNNTKISSRNTNIRVSKLISSYWYNFQLFALCDRLPIIQGGTFAFLAPTLAILSLPMWKCPAPELIADMTPEMKTELWQVRMREIQGAIIVSSLFEVALGLFGIRGNSFISII